jgi:hypothetical protein
MKGTEPLLFNAILRTLYNATVSIHVYEENENYMLYYLVLQQSYK